jgi:hypothetical protein
LCYAALRPATTYWEEPTKQGNEDLWAVAAVPDGNLVVAAGENGTVLQGKVVGEQLQWDAAAQHGDRHFFGISTVPATNLLIVVGAGGTVLQGTVIGDHVQWNAPSQHGDRDLYAIAAVPATDLVIAVGAGGTVLKGTVVGDQVQWDAPSRYGDQDLWSVTAESFGLEAIAADRTALNGTVNGDDVQWNAETNKEGDVLFAASVAVPSMDSTIKIHGTLKPGAETKIGHRDFLRMAVAQDPELVVAVGRAGFVLSLHWSAAQVQWGRSRSAQSRAYV